MRTRTVNREKARWRAEIVEYCGKDEFCRWCFFASDDVCTWEMILLESVTSRESFLVQKKLVDWVRFFFCFLGFSMVERCEWENERFCENNFDMACCWEKRTRNGIEIIVGRCSVRYFVWFSSMNWRELVEWNELIWSFCWCLQRMSVCLSFSLNYLLEGRMEQCEWTMRIKIEVFSIIRLVELTVLR